MKKSAFTLAEVLITLGIIGVVAAMTIPTLISNYKKTQYVTGLKRAYSMFNQALLQYTNDGGCPNDLNCMNVIDWSGDPSKFGDGIIKYFKIAKKCDMTTSSGCFSNSVSMSASGEDGRVNWDGGGLYKFITADGISYMIETPMGNCDQNNYSLNITNNMTQVCGYVTVDVNGMKNGPNNQGRDIFKFYISNGKGALLYPIGGADVADSHWNDDSGMGGLMCSNAYPDSRYCTARVMEEGWQMNY